MSKVKMHHLLILDSSSSMGSVLQETLDGFNQQIETIKQTQKDYEREQEHFVSLVVFGGGSVDFKMWKKPCNETESLDRTSYTPFGMTPLYDAIGMGIQGLKNEIIEDLKNDDTRISVTIFTDGQENNSREFDGPAASAVVQEVQDGGKWLVTFVGCDDNVFEVAESLGISRGNTMRYASGSEGTTQAFTRMSNTYRKMSDSVKMGTFDHLVIDGAYSDTDTEEGEE